MRRAMTLIEVLVVITIIALLIGLLVPTTRFAMRAARASGTAQRINGVLAGLAGLSSTDGVAARIQREAGLGGVLAFDYPNGFLAPTQGTWLTYGAPHHLRFPYGQKRLQFQGNGAGASELPPADFTLGQLSPAKSLELLVAAGIIPAGSRAEAAYAENRSGDVAWNDRWGNPLVVGYALYQYGPATGSGESAAGTKEFDNQWRTVLQRYGRTRSLLVAVGAGGPVLPAGFDGQLGTLLAASDRPATLAALWAHIDTVANRLDDGTTPRWRVDASASVNAAERAPWVGIRQAGDSEGRYCLLSAPQELQ